MPATPTQDEMTARLQRVWDHFAPDPENADIVAELEGCNVVLVQRHTTYGQRWLSVFASINDALDYAQRDDDDWTPEIIVDLRTGVAHEVVVRMELGNPDGSLSFV